MTRDARPESDAICTAEAAALLNCGPDYVRRLVRDGRLSVLVATRAGRLISKQDVLALAKTRRKQRRTDEVKSLAKSLDEQRRAAERS